MLQLHGTGVRCRGGLLMIDKMLRRLDNKQGRSIASIIERQFLRAVVLAVFLFRLSFSTLASPTPHTVTKLADTNDGACDSDCSLREALGAAVSDDVIDFAPGLVGTITLSSTLNIIKNIAISGPGTKSITISGNDAVRVFYVNPEVHFILRNLIVTKGYTIGTQGASGTQQLSVSGQAGGPAKGGGLYNDKGIVTIINSTFSTNRAIGGSGGFGAWPDHTLMPVAPGVGGTAFGGAIFSSGSIVLTDSTFAENQAIGGNPGDTVQNGIPRGPGGNGMGGALYLAGAGAVSNCTFYKNAAIGAAGRDQLQKGGDGIGGALYASAAVSLVNSTFSQNRAKGGAGGVCVSGNYMYAPVYADCAGDGGNGQGGASYFVNDAWISNCTYYGNAAQGGSPGGMIRGKSRAIGSGGAIYRPVLLPRGKTLDVNKSTVITIKNTILSDSSSGANCDAPLVSGGYNLDSDESCGLAGPGDISKVNPKLGSLRQNGGDTCTHALLPSSPAINGGNPAGCTDHDGVLISTDQRGLSRSSRCDIGAFEVSR